MSGNQNQKNLSILLLSFIPAMVLFDPVSEHTSLHSGRFNEKHATARDPAARGGGEEREREEKYIKWLIKKEACAFPSRGYSLLSHPTWGSFP